MQIMCCCASQKFHLTPKTDEAWCQFFAVLVDSEVCRYDKLRGHLWRQRWWQCPVPPLTTKLVNYQFCIKIIFLLAVSRPNYVYRSYVITTNCRFYISIQQILRLFKTWVSYNKLDSMKSLGVYYWYDKIPQRGYMEHGLKILDVTLKMHSTSVNPL